MVKLWTCTFRLAPVKDISIPMFELLAYFFLNRLIASVKIAVESEVEIECSVRRVPKLYCGGYGKCIKSGTFGCRTGPRKFGRMLTAKTGFMYQLH